MCEAEKRTKTKKHGREEDDEDEEIEGEETRQTKNSEQGEKRRKRAMELESLIWRLGMDRLQKKGSTDQVEPLIEAEIRGGNCEGWWGFGLGFLQFYFCIVGSINLVIKKHIK